MATRKKTIDFEASLEQLESIVETLEEGNLGLEESLKSFEKGIKITRACQSALQNAEQRVRLLTTRPDSDVVSTAFTSEADE
ncbi:MAG: exodeoxyribonuclease VII small subunit [Porticoccaceae bacterium]|nr:exodeoxyribonuclease VII small subunit [Porticoccaceae bacterium]